MVSNRFKQLNVYFPVVEPRVDRSAESDVQVGSDFLGQDFSVEGEYPEVERLERLRGEEDLVNGDFDLLDFSVVFRFRLVVGPDSVEPI